jgi:glutamate-1-semialdehyde 2,1-aminomutase
MVRFVATGTEAAMSALRLARAATQRSGVIKFSGCYHGHADPFLVSAGSGAATFGTPDSPGVTQGAASDTVVARFNDLESVDQAFAARPGGIAALFVEPVPGNMGCIPPATGFLAGLRERCDREGAILVFDEIITGFRIGRAGAAERFGVTPDLILLGKALGGGTPIAAFGGKSDIMRLLSPAGPVYQAGTYAANPLSIAAALATLDEIDADEALYDRLEATGALLAEGLEREAGAAVGEGAPPFHVQRVGSMWTPFFSPSPVRSWDDTEAVNREAHARFFAGMLKRGVLLPPSPFESAFVSAAHTDDDVAFTVDAARHAFQEAWS